MDRKTALVVGLLVVGMVSVVLMGGEPPGYLWWGDHAPICIWGDSDFTAANGVTGGSGTQDDPYIISGWSIDDPSTDYGIYIDHTTSYFIIRGCVIERARNAGIYLNSVENGRIEGCELSLNGIGIHLLNSKHITVTKNALFDNHYGIVMEANARDNVVFENSFIQNGVNGRDVSLGSNWSNGKTGNYWSDYKGTDENGDGRGDSPYTHPLDPYPLINPPVKPTHGIPARGPVSSLPRSPQGYLVVNSGVPIALQAHDPGSGVARILYSINGGDWKEYSSPFNLSGPDGVYKVSYYGIDHLGNREAVRSLTFLLDNHPPRTQISFGSPNYQDATGQWITSKTPVTLSLTAKSTYGVTKTYFAIDDGPWQPYTGPFHIRGADGPHRISYYSRNASGITEAVSTVTVYKDDVPPSTIGKTVPAPAITPVPPVAPEEGTVQTPSRK